jgi:hypothetical protein
MALSNETYSLIKPFTAKVGANGQTSIPITHNQSGLIWQIFQIGFALGVSALTAQVGAHFNGIPLTSSVLMQPVMFVGVPFAMESFFVGPPYVGLKAGDQIVCSVINASPGDIFTAGAFISEEQDPGISTQWWG